MAKRLIDADALEADLRRQYDEVYGNARKTVNPDDFYIDRCAAYRASVVEAEQKGFFEYLKTRPTVDAVEVVRCRDCRWRGSEQCAMFYRCDCGEQHTWETDGDFCSYGERKEG